MVSHLLRYLLRAVGVEEYVEAVLAQAQLPDEGVYYPGAFDRVELLDEVRKVAESVFGRVLQLRLQFGEHLVKRGRGENLAEFVPHGAFQLLRRNDANRAGRHGAGVVFDAPVVDEPASRLHRVAGRHEAVAMAAFEDSPELGYRLHPLRGFAVGCVLRRHLARQRPLFARDERRVDSLVLDALVGHKPLVGDVLEDFVDVPRKPRCSRLLGSEPVVQLLCDLFGALDDRVALEDESYRLGLRLVHDEFRVLVLLVSVWSRGGGPASGGSRGAELAEDALGVHLALQLGEVHHDAGGGASGGGLEFYRLRGAGDFDAVLAQLVFDIPEVALVAVDAVELVDDDDVDLAVADIAHHPLESRAVGRAAGKAAVLEHLPRVLPAVPGVALDEPEAGVALCVD